MTKAKTNRIDKHLSPIPNNPRDNQLYVDKKEKRDEDKFNRERMLFDKTEQINRVIEAFRRYSNSSNGLQRIISKHEPGEPTKLEYPKINKKAYEKDMEFRKQKSREAIARERLKRKGAVPTKSGKKLFEDFMKDMREATGTNKQQNIDDADMRNIYNSAQHLTYDKWIWYINDEYGSRI